MPSRFTIRERLGVGELLSFKAGSGSLLTSRPPSPAPPSTRARSPAPKSAPSTPPVPSASAVNHAFILALKTYIDDLSLSEQQEFNDNSTITPEALIAQVKRYDETHSQMSHSRRCASRVQGFLAAVDGYMQPVSIIAGQSPNISSLVVGGVKLIVQLGLKFATFFGKLTEMMEHLTDHLGYLSQYAENFKHSQQVQGALSSAYRDLLKFLKGARCVFVDTKGNPRRWVSFRIFLRVTWEPFQENFDALDSEFRSHVEIVIRTAAIVEHERLRSKEVLEAEKNEDEDRRKLLLWFSEVDFDKDHDLIFSKRHQDTGNWLVYSPEFGNWVDAKGSSLLWCYGNPGIGKSVLVSLVLETISTKYSLDSRIGIVFVYFNYQQQGVQKPGKILSTMIKQLARQKKVLPNELKQFYKKHYRDASFPSNEQLEAQFSELSKTFDQVFIVMDAMDEFEDRKDFLSIITRFAQRQDSSTKFKVFLTSRRERDIEIAFNRCHFPTIQIEVKKVDVDIAAFVLYQMQQRTWEENGVLIDQALKDKIAYVLTSKSNGMFLWVKYQLDYIYEQPSIKDINAALNSLPDDMNATYIRILGKINKQTPAKRKIARRALMWVASAGRPLTIEELAIAVSIDPESKSHKALEVYDKRAVLHTCGNLLTVEEDIVRPVHYTVQEFLTVPQSDLDTESLALLQKYQSNTNDNAELAQICLQYLLFEELGSCETNLIYWEYEERFPFGMYAAAYWDYHVQNIRGLPVSLASTIDEFLDTDGTSLSCAYRMRNKVDLEHDTEMDPLSFCLSFNLLHLFQRSHCFDAAIRDSKKYKEVLHRAAEGGSTSSIKALLEMGFSVQAYDSRNQPPLYYAAKSGHEAAADLLLENGADVNAQGGDYGSILYAAADGGHGAVVQMLLSAGADVNAQTGFHGTASQAAICGGHQVVVQALLGKGADVNVQGGHFGNALQAATLKGDEMLVQTLLIKGADVNAQSGYYGNALQAAACEGNEMLVQMLLDKGANVNAQGGLCGNALQAAAHGGYETVVQVLLAEGADVNIQGGFFGNALQATAFGGYGTVVQILLAKGADINARGGYYGNALQAAADRGRETVVQILLAKGADVNAQGGHYGSALQAAACEGHETVVQILLAEGADVNVQGGYYDYALEAAVYGGHETVVQMLLEEGADVNKQGESFSSALQSANHYDYKSIAQLLVQAGAHKDGGKVTKTGIHNSSIGAGA